ncbi:transmembrane protein 120A-like [Notothenia coriiceps]|uniref:Transmembrane protein 120A-like n=1 Tax=Notothenia coriiceps TaxID=8208 RepID=A0A6I9PPG1_9TELE|nr:PREDICTED: transmembrane protein 120A-like [Notothenia coriiceps]
MSNKCPHRVVFGRSASATLLGRAAQWLYLNLVLGNVNVTLLNKQSKFAYKDEYEKFKLVLTVILFVFSFTCRFLFSYRALDALFNFLLVWYYCTLTIRESVLINNGSRYSVFTLLGPHLFQSWV